MGQARLGDERQGAPRLDIYVSTSRLRYHGILRDVYVPQAGYGLLGESSRRQRSNG